MFRFKMPAKNEFSFCENSHMNKFEKPLSQMNFSIIFGYIFEIQYEKYNSFSKMVAKTSFVTLRNNAH